MIEKINAKGLMGLPDFEQPLDRLNLFTGPNGAGKSARSIAAMLAVLGYIPGGPKKNADILSAYCAGDKLFVGITAGKTRFMRRFCRKEDGTVSQDYLLDGRKCNAKEYIQAIAPVRIMDLRAGFLDLSDQKKIDVLFSLFPPGGDLADLDEKIEALKIKQNNAVAKIKTLEGTVQNLTASRAALQLPAGTLAEISQQIVNTEIELKAAMERHVEAQVRAAQEKATAEATQKAEAKAAAALPAIEAAATARAENAIYQRQQEAAQAIKETTPVTDLSMGQVFAKAVKIDASASIRAILDTMHRAGCSSCAAVLVAKRELKKYKTEGAPA